MPQTLRWVIAASLLVQIAKCDAIPANAFLASRYADQSNIFRVPFWTGISTQALLRTSGFASNSYGSAGFERQISSPNRLLLLSPPVGSAIYRFGGQRDIGETETLWRYLTM